MNPTFAERRTVVALEALPEKSATKVHIEYPAILKSACAVNIKNFPFDKQVSRQLERKKIRNFQIGAKSF